MKNIIANITLKLVLPVLAISCMATSCSLTEYPEDSVSPEKYFSTGAACVEWMNGCYTQLENYGVYYLDTDDFLRNQPSDFFKGSRSPSTESWSWTMLRRINYFIENAHYCKDEATRNTCLGLAHFHRAYFYFEKVKKYGDIMWYDRVIGSKDTDLLYKARDSREYVVDRIIEDLDKAAQLLEPVAPNAYMSNITKWVALALKARVCMFEGSFVKYHELDEEEDRIHDSDYYFNHVVDACLEIMDSGKFSIYNVGDTPYKDVFVKSYGAGKEVILSRVFTEGYMQRIYNNIRVQNAGLTQRFINHYLTSDGRSITTRANYDKEDFFSFYKNRDFRLTQTVWTEGAKDYADTKIESIIEPYNLNAITGYFPIKWCYDINVNDNDKPIILFRYAEVLLDYAEALAELGEISQPDLDASINKLRDRGGKNVIPALKMDAPVDALMQTYYPKCVSINKSYPHVKLGLLLEIRRERTIELVMEGRHQWDIIRWAEGSVLDNTKNPIYGLYIPGPGVYDFRGDGKLKVEIYENTPSGQTVAKKLKLNQDIYLSEGTSGHIVAFKESIFTFDEDRDYLWPIPVSQRNLVPELTQNPGWDDGLDR